MKTDKQNKDEEVSTAQNVEIRGAKFMRTALSFLRDRVPNLKVYPFVDSLQKKYLPLSAKFHPVSKRVQLNSPNGTHPEKVNNPYSPMMPIKFFNWGPRPVSPPSKPLSKNFSSNKSRFHSTKLADHRTETEPPEFANNNHATTNITFSNNYSGYGSEIKPNPLYSGNKELTNWNKNKPSTGSTQLSLPHFGKDEHTTPSSNSTNLPNSKISPKNQQWTTNLEKMSHFNLDSRLQRFLSSILNIRIPKVKIFVNQQADALARNFNADAITYDENLLFRAGKFDPKSNKGMALLGHELTHVVHSKLHGKRAKIPVLQEEKEALTNERKILNYFGSHKNTPLTSYNNYSSRNSLWKSHNDGLGYRDLVSPSQPTGRLEASSPNPHHWRPLGRQEAPGGHGNNSRSTPLRPTAPTIPTHSEGVRAAASARDLGGSTPAPPTALTLSDQQLRMIKEEVYRDLKDRIRTEFERGG